MTDLDLAELRRKMAPGFVLDYDGANEVIQAVPALLDRIEALEAERAGIRERDEEVAWQTPDTIGLRDTIQAWLDEEHPGPWLDMLRALDALGRAETALVDARRDLSFARRQRDEEREAKSANWRSLGEWSERAAKAESALARVTEEVDGCLDSLDDHITVEDFGKTLGRIRAVAAGEQTEGDDPMRSPRMGPPNPPISQAWPELPRG